MNEAFDKILKRLDSYIEDAKSEGDFSYIKPFEIAKIAVQEVVEEYSVGWIPCSERLPEERDWCLAVFEEVDTGFIGIPYIAEYLMGTHTIATTEDGWIIHNCTDMENEYAEYYKKLRCVAWQPLPEPYKAESEDNK